MWFKSLLASWKSGVSRTRRPQLRPARPSSVRPRLEALEDRCVPTNYSAANVTQLIADINAANAAGGTNTITLTAPTTSPYALTVANNVISQAGQESANGLPVTAANDKLTIVGNGDTIERRTAAPYFRLFDVAHGGSLTLENLTLQGGYVRAYVSAAAEGGAIYNYQGTLVLNGVTVQGNSAENLDGNGTTTAGGGIFSYYGSVTLEGGTIIQNNEANAISTGGGSAYGGGLAAIGGTVTVTNATLKNNKALAGSIGDDYGTYGAACGGGLYISDGTLSLTNSTVNGNVAGLNASEGVNGTGGAYGGGLCVSYGTATLTNCIVQANSATASVANTVPSPGEGGGIFVGHEIDGYLDISFVTGGATVSLDAATVAQVTGNTASSGGTYENIVGPYTLT
jgi:hypothetical protein